MGVTARRFDIAKSGIGVLAEAFPLETVQAILAATQREGKRKRLLPASMMVYYVIALGLFVGVGCREVLRRLLDGAKWVWPNEVRVATESAISQARQRLGSVPIERLYEEVVIPIAKKITRGAWYRAWRVVTLDGFILDVAESDENVQAFGRPGSSRGRSAYPQVRVVGFLENGTHVLFGAEMDGCDVGETTIARRILGKLRKNMLCLADRNFLCYPLWQQAVATGAKLVWRAKLQLVIPKMRKLSDGSYLAKIYPSPKHRRADREGSLSGWWTIRSMVFERRIGWSRTFSIRTRHRRTNWRSFTQSAGQSRPRSTSSRHTCAAATSCSAASCRSWFGKTCSVCCWRTTACAS